MSEFIIGKNAVLESLRLNKNINYIMLANKNKLQKNKELFLLSSKNKIPIKIVNSKKLDLILKSTKHQGIVASASFKRYSSVNDIIKHAENKKEDAFIIICDQIEDPHNLGAIIRTAEGAGAHGIIIPQRRSASLNFTVNKASAGALEHMFVSRVSNLTDTIKDLKSHGIFVYGADMTGKNLWSKDVNLSGPIAIVVGNEGKGLGRLVKEKCDELICVPIYGKLDSLNVSVATAILSYEVVRTRKVF